MTNHHTLVDTQPPAADMPCRAIFISDKGESSYSNISAHSTLSQAQSSQGLLWLHFEENTDTVRDWLEQNAQIDDLAVATLLQQETQSRYAEFDSNHLVILRTLDSQQAQHYQDIKSVRLWICERFIISICRAPSSGITKLQEYLVNSQPDIAHVGDFMTLLIERLTEDFRRIVPIMDALVNEIEDDIINPEKSYNTSKLLDTRRKIIWIRRHLTPQLDTFEELLATPPQWCSNDNRLKIRECLEITERILNALSAIRDHAVLLESQIDHLVNQKTQKTVYVLTILTAIFLPINFIAALLGVNLGGIPGSSNPSGFVFLAITLIIVTALELFILRKLKWI